MRNIPAQYAACRAWQHAWDFTTVERSGGEYIQGMRCMRCGTERLVRLNARTGLREGNRYIYPEDMDSASEPYKVPKGTGGALTAEERGAVRLSDVKAHYTVIKDELAKRRRKA